MEATRDAATPTSACRIPRAK